MPVFPKMRGHYFDLKSIDPDAESIAGYDALLLATNHTKFDYAMFKQYARLIVDTRGVYLELAENIVKA